MLKSQNILKFAVIAVLVGLAIVLGFFIYKQKHPAAKSTKTDVTQTGTNTATDEQKLFAPPGPKATKEEIAAHSALAAKLAVLGNEIDLTSCKAAPAVLQVKQGSEVTVKNNDSSNLAVTFDSEHIYYVDANKSASIKAAFTHGPGLYGYRCKNNSVDQLSGFISVTP